ncbi:hypothetical protein G9A89_016738 [Geosiphon pyriformis]|nr:hypothetical protein G9A89_016738 [Geosiphon pyriformis]
MQQWLDIEFSNIDILEKKTREVLLQFRLISSKVPITRRQQQKFCELAKETAIETYKRSLFAFDVMTYIETLSQEDVVGEDLIQALQLLINEAQVRKQGMKDLMTLYKTINKDIGICLIDLKAKQAQASQISLNLKKSKKSKASIIQYFIFQRSLLPALMAFCLVAPSTYIFTKNYYIPTSSGALASIPLGLISAGLVRRHQAGLTRLLNTSFSDISRAFFRRKSNMQPTIRGFSYSSINGILQNTLERARFFMIPAIAFLFVASPIYYSTIDRIQQITGFALSTCAAGLAAGLAAVLTGQNHRGELEQRPSFYLAPFGLLGSSNNYSLVTAGSLGFGSFDEEKKKKEYSGLLEKEVTDTQRNIDIIMQNLEATSDFWEKQEILLGELLKNIKLTNEADHSVLIPSDLASSIISRWEEERKHCESSPFERFIGNKIEFYWLNIFINPIASKEKLFKMSESHSTPLSHRAFSITLILENIFAHIALERHVRSCLFVSRWWNQVATERLWYKFSGLANEPKTKSFQKFFQILRAAHKDQCSHRYGRYVQVLDFERLKLQHDTLLETLECCPRLEHLILRGGALNKRQVANIAQRIPNIKFIKLNGIDVHDGEAFLALAKNCHYLEELSLKKDIECEGEVLVEIVKKCSRISKLCIEHKGYEDEIMNRVFRHCPNLNYLNLNQCINLSEDFLVNIYRFCPKLTGLLITNMYEIMNEFILATASYFKNSPSLSIQKVDRPWDNQVDANESKIDVCLAECDFGRIIDFYRTRPQILKKLTLTNVTLNKRSLGIICESLDVSLLNLDRVAGIQKEDILDAVPKLRNLETLYVLFQTYEINPLLREEQQKLAEACPSLTYIMWHRQNYSLQRNESD